MEKCGYVQVHNDAATDGLWRINDKRQVVYAKSELPLREQLNEARKLAGIKGEHGADQGAAAPGEEAPSPAGDGKANTVIIEADPDHPCAQCGGSPDNGNVYRIRGPNQAEAPLHRECAAFFFKLR